MTDRCPKCGQTVGVYLEDDTFFLRVHTITHRPGDTRVCLGSKQQGESYMTKDAIAHAASIREAKAKNRMDRAIAYHDAGGGSR